MNKRVVVILMVIVILCTTFMGVEVDAKDDLTEKLKENLIPIKTTKAENGFEDLMPLKEILKDKKIVGMGEATHGTAEFFEMKHRMFEFLVEEMEYRVFAIEAEFGGSQIVNEYILEGKGNVENCFKAMGFWTWNTEEVADMIQWMKDYNENPQNESKIKFYGFDMQTADDSLDYIFDYLRSVGSNDSNEYILETTSLISNLYLSEEMIEKLNRNIGYLHSDIKDNKDNYIKNSSVEEYELMLHHFVVINQYIERQSSESGLSRFEFRDKSMAQNVKWILEYEEKYYGNNKIMLWAHNGHIANKSFGIIVMGEELKYMYEDDYYAIGFDFYKGDFVATIKMDSYNANNGKLGKFSIDSSPKDSFAYKMEKTGVPISFLDFQTAKEEKTLSKFLKSRRHINGIGSVYSGQITNFNVSNNLILKDSFNAMIFIESTSAAVQANKNHGSVLDGDALLTDQDTQTSNVTLSIVAVIVLFFLAFFILYRLSKKHEIREKTDEMSSDKFYILGKKREENEKLNIIERVVVRGNGYFNSISLIEHSIIFVGIILVLTIIKLNIDSFDRTSTIFMYINGGSTNEIMIKSLLRRFFNQSYDLILVYIVPLNILKFISKDKKIKFGHIILVSIVLSILVARSYLSTGIYASSINLATNLIIAFIYAFMYSYTYAIYNDKIKRPISIILIYSAIESIIFILASFIAFKI